MSSKVFSASTVSASSYPYRPAQSHFTHSRTVPIALQFSRPTLFISCSPQSSSISSSSSLGDRSMDELHPPSSSTSLSQSAASKASRPLPQVPMQLQQNYSVPNVIANPSPSPAASPSSSASLRPLRALPSIPASPPSMHTHFAVNSASGSNTSRPTNLRPSSYYHDPSSGSSKAPSVVSATSYVSNRNYAPSSSAEASSSSTRTVTRARSDTVPTGNGFESSASSSRTQVKRPKLHVQTSVPHTSIPSQAKAQPKDRTLQPSLNFPKVNQLTPQSRPNDRRSSLDSLTLRSIVTHIPKEVKPHRTPRKPTPSWAYDTVSLKEMLATDPHRVLKSSEPKSQEVVALAASFADLDTTTEELSPMEFIAPSEDEYGDGDILVKAQRRSVKTRRSPTIVRSSNLGPPQSQLPAKDVPFRRTNKVQLNLGKLKVIPGRSGVVKAVFGGNTEDKEDVMQVEDAPVFAKSKSPKVFETYGDELFEEDDNESADGVSVLSEIISSSAGRLFPQRSQVEDVVSMPRSSRRSTLHVVDTGLGTRSVGSVDHSFQTFPTYSTSGNAPVKPVSVKHNIVQKWYKDKSGNRLEVQDIIGALKKL